MQSVRKIPLQGGKGNSLPTYFLLPKMRHRAAGRSSLLPIFVPLDINFLILGSSLTVCNRGENFYSML